MKISKRENGQNSNATTKDARIPLSTSPAVYDVKIHTEIDTLTGPVHSDLLRVLEPARKPFDPSINDLLSVVHPTQLFSRQSN